MLIGTPREIKPGEFRVALTPEAVSEIVAHGWSFILEAGGGQGAGFADADYRAAGAIVTTDVRDVYAADLVVKVKEPQPQELERLRPGQILFGYLHLAADPDQAGRLRASGVTAVAFETVTDPQGGLPLLAPMSEIAGRLAVLAAAERLMRSHGGKGLLFTGAPGVSPARVTVLGAGVVGSNAARLAAAMGAQVTVLERSDGRLRQIDELYAGRIRTRRSTRAALLEEIATADVVIGAVLAPGGAAPKLVRREDLRLMKPGAVLVDVAIDQGGCFETSRPTTYADPVFQVDGIIHYCVANMPGAVPLTASEALSGAILPYVLALAEGGLKALADNPHLGRGLNVMSGRLTHPAVAAALGEPLEDPFGLWSGSR